MIMLYVQIDLGWLKRWCDRIAGGDHAGAVADAVCHILLLDKSADESAMELLELVGDGAFEAIAELMDQR